MNLHQKKIMQLNFKNECIEELELNEQKRNSGLFVK